MLTYPFCYFLNKIYTSVMCAMIILRWNITEEHRLRPPRPVLRGLSRAHGKHPPAVQAILDLSL